jgi:hypothetical protein
MDCRVRHRLLEEVANKKKITTGKGFFRGSPMFRSRYPWKTFIRATPILIVFLILYRLLKPRLMGYTRILSDFSGDIGSSIPIVSKMANSGDFSSPWLIKYNKLLIHEHSIIPRTHRIVWEWTYLIHVIISQDKCTKAGGSKGMNWGKKGVVHPSIFANFGCQVSVAGSEDSFSFHHKRVNHTLEDYFAEGFVPKKRLVFRFLSKI